MSTTDKSILKYIFLKKVNKCTLLGKMLFTNFPKTIVIESYLVGALNRYIRIIK